MYPVVKCQIVKPIQYMLLQVSQFGIIAQNGQKSSVGFEGFTVENWIEIPHGVVWCCQQEETQANHHKRIAISQIVNVSSSSYHMFFHYSQEHLNIYQVVNKFHSSACHSITECGSSICCNIRMLVTVSLSVVLIMFHKPIKLFTHFYHS